MYTIWNTLWLLSLHISGWFHSTHNWANSYGAAPHRREVWCAAWLCAMPLNRAWKRGRACSSGWRGLWWSRWRDEWKKEWKHRIERFLKDYRKKTRKSCKNANNLVLDHFVDANKMVLIKFSQSNSKIISDSSHWIINWILRYMRNWLDYAHSSLVYHFGSSARYMKTCRFPSWYFFSFPFSSSRRRSALAVGNDTLYLPAISLMV